MTVGIVGLGLIGGSAAKAYAHAGHKVLGHDLDEAMLSFAELAGAVSDSLTEKNICECQLLLIAVYPEAAAEYLSKTAPYISRDTLVIDLCGTKELICKTGFKLAEEYGFTYAGGHPMAVSYTHLDVYKRQGYLLSSRWTHTAPRRCSPPFQK